MKKYILFSLLSSLLGAASLPLTISNGWFLDGNRIMEKFPIENPNLVSKENGGNLSVEEAYSDGVGVVLIGLRINNSPFNKLATKYGSVASQKNLSLTEYVRNNISDKNMLTLANKVDKNFVSGAPCSDGASCYAIGTLNVTHTTHGPLKLINGFYQDQSGNVLLKINKWVSNVNTANLVYSPVINGYYYKVDAKTNWWSGGSECIRRGMKFVTKNEGRGIPRSFVRGWINTRINGTSVYMWSATYGFYSANDRGLQSAICIVK